MQLPFQGGARNTKFNLKGADHAQARTDAEPVHFLHADQNPGLDARVGLAWHALLPAAQAQNSFTVTDLGTVGGNASEALGVNNHGEVIGDSRIPNSTLFHAFLYSGGQMQDLGTLGGDISDAIGINDYDQVVGQSGIFTANGETFHAFLYSGGRMQDLTPSGFYSGAWGINDRSEVSGLYIIDPIQGTIHAFLYSAGQLRDLGTLGGNTSIGAGINDRGQVVGHSFTNGNTADHAFLYSGGQMQDLGALGTASASNKSVALRINEHGQIVGYGYLHNDSGISHAFLYSSGQLRDLGTLPGNDSSQAYDINNRGEIVGAFLNATNVSIGAFFYVGGQMWDLNKLLAPNLGWTITNATGINDAGQIAGTGTLNGQTHALLLTPVH